MRRLHSKRQLNSSQDWRAEMTRAVAAFCIVLLLAPTLIEATRVHGRRLPAGQPAGRRIRRTGVYCSKQIAGCTVCTEEAGPTAAGAQFPGTPEAVPRGQNAVTIVRCLRCHKPSYVYNKENENCDCAAGAGTAFPNGTLVSVDHFTPAVKPVSPFSDSMEFPEYTKSSNKSISSRNSTTNSSSNSTTNTTTLTDAQLAEATTNNFAEASDSINELGLVREMSLNRAKQPQQRRRFEQYMREMGYNVRSSRQGTFLSERPTKAAFSSVDDQPAGVSSTPESPMVCSACKANAVSVGGLIGGSFCMPCESGTTPDHVTGTCKSLS